MTDKVFVDSDICLDLLTARLPHYHSAARLFSLSETGRIKLSVSTLILANIHYILLRTHSASESRELLIALKKLVTTLAVTDHIIEQALHSDFEDGIQYFTAVENHVKVLLTRNLRDYKTAKISVMTPEAYLKSIA